MKKFIVASAFISASVFAADGTIVSVGSERTFAPRGFDDNDQVQLVIEGRLPSDCYRLEQPDVRVNAATKHISIQPKASYYNWLCLEVLVPWTQVVNVGRLPAGEWNIKVGSNGEPETLPIKLSTTVSPDDHVYAPVDSLSVDLVDGQAIATIKGRFTTRCGELTDLKVLDSGKTIEILPIMTAGTARSCEHTEQPFEQKILLPHKSKGRYLVHVRSLNGLSHNQVYEMP